MAGEFAPAVPRRMTDRPLRRNGFSASRYIETDFTAIFKRIGQLTVDALMVGLTLWVAYVLRFDGEVPAQYLHQLFLALPWAVGLYLSSNAVSGNYHRIWRFFELRNDAGAVARSVAIVLFGSIAWRFVDAGVLGGKPVPFGVLLIHPFLAFYGLVAARIGRSVTYNRSKARAARAPTAKARRRLLLAGAGEAGLLLLHQLRNADLEIVGFVDDDRELQGRTIGGWRILGSTRELETVVRAHHVDEVILCMPSAPKSVLQRIVAECERHSIKVSTVPTLFEIVTANVPIGQLRPVRMEDLLGRHTVIHPQDLEGLASSYRDSRILVTGAGGSIGSELVRQLCLFQPAEVILLDKDENSLYEIACEIRENFDHVLEVVGDVRNRASMEKLFKLHKPEVVFHAAAYKHVPLMEHFPSEAILNNAIGTKNIAELSDAFGVKIFVLISTDKAVNPSSIMGASKRVAEMLVQSLAAGHSTTRFCCVRFGNVLGSRASVVPIFQRQIRQGRNITVTHPDVRRYFMTIPEAVQLVIQAGSLGEEGEIFLLDMGNPVKIVDLARNLIELSGLTPDKDVSIEFTGLRPGEKLNEELLIAGESGARSTKHSKIFVVEALDRDWSRLPIAVKALEDAAGAGDSDVIRQILQSINIGFRGTQARRESPVRVVTVDSDRQREKVGRSPDLMQ